DASRLEARRLLCPHRRGGRAQHSRATTGAPGAGGGCAMHAGCIEVEGKKVALDRSPPLESWLALLEEGSHTLAMVLRLAAAQMRDRLAVEERAEVARRGDVHVLLHVAEAHERSMRDAACNAAHLGEKRVAREDAVHEPEPRRLVGGEEIRQEEELL